MNGGARLPLGQPAPSGRQAIDQRVTAEARRGGEIVLHLVSMSAHGFTVRGDVALDKGDRVTVPLPAVGRIEAFVSWRGSGRAGFQLERILRPREFARIIEALRPPPPPDSSAE